MPSCISVFTNVDFTAVALSAPQDGFSIAVAMATPTPTPGPTGGPTATPAPSPSDTPIPTASPTETPSPSPSETPLPTPSPTSAALCISVDGSTNGFNTAQLAGPDNGFSFANNNIVNPTPTPPAPSPTPLPISNDPCAPSSPIGYGSGNVMSVTFPSANIGDPTTFVWFQMDTSNRKLHIDNAVDMGVDDAGLRRGQFVFNDCNNPFSTGSLTYSGLTGSGISLNAVTLIGLAYTTSTVGGGPGPYQVWFE